MRRYLSTAVAGLLCFFATSCVYDFPLTATPTGKVDERLLGDWVSPDGKEKMKIGRYDDSVYIVCYDGLYRAFHSDVGKMRMMSVQELESKDRKYSYLTWRLSDDGKTLFLRVVNDKVIPKEIKDSAAAQALLSSNADNPNLFQEESQFQKKEK